MPNFKELQQKVMEDRKARREARDREALPQAIPKPTSEAKKAPAKKGGDVPSSTGSKPPSSQKGDESAPTPRVVLPGFQIKEPVTSPPPPAVPSYTGKGKDKMEVPAKEKHARSLPSAPQTATAASTGSKRRAPSSGGEDTEGEGPSMKRPKRDVMVTQVDLLLQKYGADATVRCPAVAHDIFRGSCCPSDVDYYLKRPDNVLMDDCFSNLAKVAYAIRQYRSNRLNDDEMQVKLKTEYKLLKGKYDSLRSEHGGCTQKLDSLRADVDRLSRERESAVKQQRVLSDEVARLKKENKNLAAEVVLKSTDYDDLKKEFDTTVTALNDKVSVAEKRLYLKRGRLIREKERRRRNTAQLANDLTDFTEAIVGTYLERHPDGDVEFLYGFPEGVNSESEPDSPQDLFVSIKSENGGGAAEVAEQSAPGVQEPAKAGEKPLVPGLGGSPEEKDFGLLISSERPFAALDLLDRPSDLESILPGSDPLSLADVPSPTRSGNIRVDASSSARRDSQEGLSVPNILEGNKEAAPEKVEPEIIKL
ncbi:uncharacterized protein LOC126687964 [Mercurialis annua]|uniref:uncharacterized protein LOC126687964 n=2 Tax=Mercurialis annua TaxID=3986 RepID=UPI0024ADC4EC|nr:uncharacterized protein LOC126687964 [Mercurialis annua]